MTIPMFTNHESVEGLYFDSSITTPFHFVTVSGLAESPSNPVGGLSYINGDFDRGVRYCLLYTSPSPRDPKTSRMPSSA